MRLRWRRRIKVGPASEPGKHIGPVVNKRQWEQIQGYIQKGIDEGARLVAGGLGLPEGMNKGFYVRPTIFADVKPGMTIEREEIFGPVLCMIPFETRGRGGADRQRHALRADELRPVAGRGTAEPAGAAVARGNGRDEREVAWRWVLRLAG